MSALAKKGRRVVGPDCGPTPPNLSSRSLFSTGGEREREREPGIRIFIFVNTSPRARSSAKVLHRVVITSVGLHVLLVSPCDQPITEHISRFV